MSCLKEIVWRGLVFEQVLVEVSSNFPYGKLSCISLSFLLVLARTAANGSLMKSYFTLKSVSSKLSLDFCKLEIGLKLKFFAGDVHESADLVDA